ncbi:hypothetical protein GCM10010346_63810 [Streptomyces chryseus]|uniref:Uncharacterized protein n=1 Tax=Streptomyces chryseus TaxID=68186 RepID=A0ABQ3EDS9_9ACTN|nr:hypothetical protein GCM10010346_63810 [Streptomyces chryseus]
MTGYDGEPGEEAGADTDESLIPVPADRTDTLAEGPKTVCRASGHRHAHPASRAWLRAMPRRSPLVTSDSAAANPHAKPYGPDTRVRVPVFGRPRSMQPARQLLR